MLSEAHSLIAIVLQKIYLNPLKLMTWQVFTFFDQVLAVVKARYKTEISEINKIKFRFGRKRNSG